MGVGLTDSSYVFAVAKTAAEAGSIASAHYQNKFKEHAIKVSTVKSRPASKQNIKQYCFADAIAGLKAALNA